MATMQKGKQFRKRPRDKSSDEEDADITGVVRQAPSKRAALNSFASSNTFGDRSKDVLNNVIATYESTKTAAPHKYGGGAFATNEIDTEHDRDARAILEKRLQLQNSAVEALEAGDKNYRGEAAYSNYIQKDVAATLAHAKTSGTMGPVRAPTNVRGICRIDYQPDICKDYKETGFCGFGDSCIFLHDRGDYKAGWQLDKEWDEKQKAKKAAMAERLAAGMDPGDVDDDNPFLIKDDENEADDEGLPFACFLCREGFTRPVQTQCGHYFCEPCAVQRYSSDPHCAVCARQTHGIFNHAAKLAAKIKARKLAEEGKDDDAEDLRPRSKPASSGWAVVDDDNDNAPVAEKPDTPSESEDDDGEREGKQYISTFEAPAAATED